MPRSTVERGFFCAAFELMGFLPLSFTKAVPRGTVFSFRHTLGMGLTFYYIRAIISILLNRYNSID